MNFLSRCLCILLLCLGIINGAFAEAFVVKGIAAEGLQRVSRATLLEYLPVKIGQRFDTDNSEQAINALYQTGFFQDVSLARRDNILLVKVTERPVIGNIQVLGNKVIPKDKLNAVLKDLGLVEGNVFNTAVLDKVKNGLQTEYYNQGRYNAKVTTAITPQPRNRVAIKIDISDNQLK